MSQSETGASPTRQLTVEYRPVSSLKPDPRNARTHPKRQLNQLRASILQFGFTNPILVDEEGVLIAGHGRLRAAKDIGLPKVPVIEIDGLSDAEKKALRIADNKIALNAGWDLEILKLELAEISMLDVDFDLSLTGFSSRCRMVWRSKTSILSHAILDPRRHLISRSSRQSMRS
jgi:hypothetical protein